MSFTNMELAIQKRTGPLKPLREMALPNSSSARLGTQGNGQDGVHAQ